MNNSIKTIVLSLVFVFALQTQAQVKFGVKAGLNIANISQDYKDSQDENATKSLIGYHIGVTAEYNLTDEIVFQSGLLLNNKGVKWDLEDDLESDETVEGYYKTTYTYLEIPLHIAYTLNDLQVYAGPYLAFGISGKEKWDATFTYDGESVTEKGENTLKPIFGEISKEDLEDEDFKGGFSAFDYGFDLGVAYPLGPVVVNLGYSIGLGNLTLGYEDYEDYDPKDNKVSNRVLSLSATYYFGE